MTKTYTFCRDSCRPMGLPCFPSCMLVSFATSPFRPPSPPSSFRIPHFGSAPPSLLRRLSHSEQRLPMWVLFDAYTDPPAGRISRIRPVRPVSRSLLHQTDPPAGHPVPGSLRPLKQGASLRLSENTGNRLPTNASQTALPPGGRWHWKPGAPTPRIR